MQARWGMAQQFPIIGTSMVSISPNVDEVEFLKGYKILDFYMGTHSYVYKIMQRSLQQGALKLQLFVNSLTRPAFKWYINLVPRSVHSWQAMAELFHARFYNRT